MSFFDILLCFINGDGVEILLIRSIVVKAYFFYGGEYKKNVCV